MYNKPTVQSNETQNSLITQTMVQWYKLFKLKFWFLTSIVYVYVTDLYVRTYTLYMYITANFNKTMYMYMCIYTYSWQREIKLCIKVYCSLTSALLEPPEPEEI